MSEQHTPGRLTLLPNSKTTIYTADEYETFVASCGTGQINRTKGDQANARRLAACWNALDGIITTEIEAAARSGSIAHALERVISQRDELQAENTRLRAELEAVGAGGVQPLRAEAGWALVPVEPTLEMLDAGTDGGAVWLNERTAATVYRLMLAAAPKAPQQAEPAPPQKPKLRVGQVWLTRGGAGWDGFIARIEAKTTNPKYPFRCVTDEHYQWTVTEDGMYWNTGVNAVEDLFELISDVQEGGEA